MTSRAGRRPAGRRIRARRRGVLVGVRPTRTVWAPRGRPRERMASSASSTGRAGLVDDPLLALRRIGVVQRQVAGPAFEGGEDCTGSSTDAPSAPRPDPPAHAECEQPGARAGWRARRAGRLGEAGRGPDAGHRDGVRGQRGLRGEAGRAPVGGAWSRESRARGSRGRGGSGQGISRLRIHGVVRCVSAAPPPSRDDGAERTRPSRPGPSASATRSLGKTSTLA